jgi:formylglycine-generating enzyme required for sulfatase activity
MSSNVWEWLRSVFGKYPYPASPKERAQRKNLAADSTTARVAEFARCASRNGDHAGSGDGEFGFRVLGEGT